MSRPTIPYLNVKDTRTRFAVCVVLTLALYLLLLPLIRQAAVLAVDAGHGNTSAEASTVVSPIDRQVNHGETAWNRDFSAMPDGPLTHRDWNFENGNLVASYNNEAQTYTSRLSNVRVENGNLVIEAKPENLNGRHYTSARIDTKGSFDFTYGTLEVDMMLPAGNGTWPAAWLLPARNIYKPADFGIANNDHFAWSLNGEIDFVEAIGRIPGQNIPAAHSYNEIHAAPTYTPVQVSDPYGSYHRYGIIKTPTSITFTLDGVTYASRQKTSDSPLDWPYNQPYYLVINLALGGNWAGADGIDDATAPWLLKIRSVAYTPNY